MQLFVLFSIISFLIFLFVLYILSNDDFIFLRKSVSLEKVFNLAFLDLVAGLFLARLFYVLLHFDKGFINPFVFFLFPYFPGLNFAGGIIGAILFIFFYGRKNKLPIGHISDIFILAFYCTLPFGVIVHALLIKKIVLTDIIISIVLTGICFGGMRFLNKSVFKDGSIGVLMLLPLSLILLVSDFIKNIKKFNLQAEHAILFVSFFLLLSFFIKHERVIGEIKSK